MNVNSEKGTGLLYGTLSDARTRLHGDSRKNIARPLDHLKCILTICKCRRTAGAQRHR